VLCFAVSTSLQEAHALPTQSGIIVPLYLPPGTGWDSLVQAKISHPTVPILAIINPLNGSGQVQNPDYVQGVQNLQSNGITVLGYVYTNYAARNSTEVVNEIVEYKRFYNVTGIFFDQMSYVAGNETYYKNLDTIAKSLGITLTIGNAGVDTVPSYVETVDNIVTYDNATLPTIQYLDGWHKNFTKNNFSIIAFGVNSLDKSFVTHASSFVEYMYITNGSLPNPFDSVPSYFGDLASALDNSSNTSAIDTLTIKPVDMLANQIRGMWTELHDNNGTTISSGFAPKSYTVTSGKQYTVFVSGWNNTKFDHWDDASTNPYRAITPTHDMMLTAYYSGVIATDNIRTLTIKSEDMSGSQIVGMWTELHAPKGGLINSGFAPKSYSVTFGKQYTVFVSGWNGTVFDHWDDASTNPYRVIIPTQDMMLTAYYRK